MPPCYSKLKRLEKLKDEIEGVKEMKERMKVVTQLKKRKECDEQGCATPSDSGKQAEPGCSQARNVGQCTSSQEAAVVVMISLIQTYN